MCLFFKSPGYIVKSRKKEKDYILLHKYIPL